MKFEDKLAQSAQRIMEKENASLRVPQNPRSSKSTYWGWVATPAAAIVGVIIGMFIHWQGEAPEEDSLLAKADTVFVDRNVVDTIYLTNVVEKEKIVEKVVTKESPAVSEVSDSHFLYASDNKREQPTAVQSEPVCTSIECDGINYALLGGY